MPVLLSVKTKVFNSMRSVFTIPLFENILLLGTKGKTNNSFFFRITPNPYQYKTTAVRKVRRNDINYLLYPSDSMDWFVYFGFAENSKNKLLTLIHKDFNVIDVGANIGETTLNFAKIVGNKGNVLSLEPDPGNFLKLSENIKQNNFTNIKPLKIGAGNQHCFFDLFTEDINNKGKNRIRENTVSIKNVIEINTLETIAASENVTKVDFIKIDVEGYELKVLQGSENILNTQKPVLFIELDDKNLREQQDTAAALVKFLEDRNYSIKNAGNDAAITSRSDFKNCHYDIYAVPLQAA
jgi:FkbM family methyltransferase